MAEDPFINIPKQIDPLLVSQMSHMVHFLQIKHLADLFLKLNVLGLTLDHYSLLSFLFMVREINFSELVAITHCTSRDLTLLMTKLKRRRYVECIPKSYGEKTVRPTDKGWALERQVKSNILLQIKEALRELSQEELKSWVRVGQIVKDHTEKYR